MARLRHAGIGCPQRCSPAGWRASKLATRKARRRIPKSSRSLNGIQVPHHRQLRPEPGSRVTTTHSKHPRGGLAEIDGPPKAHHELTEETAITSLRSRMKQIGTCTNLPERGNDPCGD